MILEEVMDHYLHIALGRIPTTSDRNLRSKLDHLNSDYFKRTSWNWLLILDHSIFAWVILPKSFLIQQLFHHGLLLYSHDFSPIWYLVPFNFGFKRHHWLACLLRCCLKSRIQNRRSLQDFFGGLAAALSSSLISTIWSLLSKPWWHFHYFLLYQFRHRQVSPLAYLLRFHISF